MVSVDRASSIYDRRGSSASATDTSSELDTAFIHLDPVGALFEPDEPVNPSSTALSSRPSRADGREVLEQRGKEREGANRVGGRVEGGPRGPMGKWVEKELGGLEDLDELPGALPKKSTSRLRYIIRGPPHASPAKAKCLPPLPPSSTPFSHPRTTTSSLFRRSPAPSPSLSATFGRGTTTTRLTLAQPLLSDDLEDHEELHITFPATSSASSSPSPSPSFRYLSRELSCQPSLPNLSALSLPCQNSADSTTPSSSTASLPHREPKSSWFRRQRKHESNASSGGQSYSTASSSVSSLASLTYSVPTTSHSHSFSDSHTRSHSHSLSLSKSQSNSDSVGTFHRRRPSIPEAAFNALRIISLGRRSQSDDLSDDELRSWKRNGEAKLVPGEQKDEKEVEMEVLEEYRDAPRLTDAPSSESVVLSLRPGPTPTPLILGDELEAPKVFRFPQPLPPTPPPDVEPARLAAAADDDSDVLESALAAAAFLSSTDPPPLRSSVPLPPLPSSPLATSSPPLVTSSSLPPRSLRRPLNRPKPALSPTASSGLNPPPRPRKSPARTVAPAPRRLISSSAWLQISLSASTARTGSASAKAKVDEVEEAKVGEFGEGEREESAGREKGVSETPPLSSPAVLLGGEGRVQNSGELAASEERGAGRGGVGGGSAVP